MGEVRLLGKEKIINSSSPGFSTVGQVLKYYREQRGLSLEEVSKKTYIKLKYLYSLEENINDVMPASIYVFSYIKHYSKLLGLDGVELVKLYQKQCNLGTLPSEPEINEKINNNKPNGIYLQNNNIVELSNKDIIKNNGNNLMNLDEIFDEHIVVKPKTENKVSVSNTNLLVENTPPVNMVNTQIPENKPLPLSSEIPSKIENKDIQKPEKIQRPVEKIVPQFSQEIINAEAEAERIIMNAKKQAEMIIKDAREEATQMVQGARSYAENVLAELEQDLNLALKEVRNGRDFLRSKVK